MGLHLFVFQGLWVFNHFARGLLYRVIIRRSVFPFDDVFC